MKMDSFKIKYKIFHTIFIRFNGTAANKMYLSKNWIIYIVNMKRIYLYLKQYLNIKGWNPFTVFEVLRGLELPDFRTIGTWR